MYQTFEYDAKAGDYLVADGKPHKVLVDGKYLLRVRVDRIGPVISINGQEMTLEQLRSAATPINRAERRAMKMRNKK